MAKEGEEEDLEALGLIGHSYDHLFAIRKRMRKLGDFTIPLRGGLTYTQVVTALVSLVVSFLMYALVVSPITILIGVEGKAATAVMALTILGPPVLLTQKAVSPMPDHKSISGWMRSWWRFHTDDKVYRRGRPINPPTYHRPGRVRHVWRVWEPTDQWAHLVDDYTPTTRATVERAFTGTVTDLETAQAATSARLAAAEKAAAQAARRRNQESDGLDLRGTDATVTGL